MLIFRTPVESCLSAPLIANVLAAPGAMLRVPWLSKLPTNVRATPASTEMVPSEAFVSVPLLIVSVVAGPLLTSLSSIRPWFVNPSAIARYAVQQSMLLSPCTRNSEPASAITSPLSVFEECVTSDPKLSSGAFTVVSAITTLTPATLVSVAAPFTVDRSRSSTATPLVEKPLSSVNVDDTSVSVPPPLSVPPLFCIYVSSLTCSVCPDASVSVPILLNELPLLPFSTSVPLVTLSVPPLLLAPRSFHVSPWSPTLTLPWLFNSAFSVRLAPEAKLIDPSKAFVSVPLLIVSVVAGPLLTSLSSIRPWFVNPSAIARYAVQQSMLLSPCTRNSEPASAIMGPLIKLEEPTKSTVPRLSSVLAMVAP